MRDPSLEVPFTDEYGEARVIRRRVGGGFSLKRTSVTPILALNTEVSREIGKRVRALRIERGLTLVDLATLIGAGTGNPKQRMWQIENPGVRSTGETYGGLRLGTLYALAIALEVDVCDLLPAVEDVSAAHLGSRTIVRVGR